jgi:hypothetical protein
MMLINSLIQTSAAVHLLSWLFCPTDDERLDQTETRLRRWLDIVYSKDD